MAEVRNSAFLAFLLSILISSMAEATPVRSLPGLQSISFWEATGTTTPYTFQVSGPELTVRRPDPLSGSNKDFSGLPDEHYDVFYSNADGTFNLNGEYLTIEGVFGGTAGGGGLNLAEIGLSFTSNTEYGNYVASFVALGTNAIPSSVGNAIDGNLQTVTTMGNTSGQPGKRLRVTLGFLSSSGPPPCGPETSSRCCQRPGACCVKDTCIQVSATDCRSLGGIFFGESTSCRVGACRVNETCVVIPESECRKLQGNYQGDNSKC